MVNDGLRGPTEEARLPGKEPVLSFGILPAVGAGSLEICPPGGRGIPEVTGRAIFDAACPLFTEHFWTDVPEMCEYLGLRTVNDLLANVNRVIITKYLLLPWEFGIWFLPELFVATAG